MKKSTVDKESTPSVSKNKFSKKPKIILDFGDKYKDAETIRKINEGLRNLKEYYRITKLEETEEIAIGYVEAFYIWLMEDEKNIHMTDFNAKFGLTVNTMGIWNKKYEGYFSYVYSICKSIQETRILHGGLTNKFNSSITIFTLKNAFGWKDKREINTRMRLKSVDLNSMTEEQLKAIAGGDLHTLRVMGLLEEDEDIE